MAVYSSVSAHLFAHEPLAFDHLKLVADCGYRRIELWAMRPHLEYEDKGTMDRLRGWLREVDLQAASFHAPFYAHFEEARAGNWLSLSTPDEDLRRKSVSLTETAMRIMSDLGAPIAVLHPCGPSPSDGADTWNGLRKSLETLLPLAERLKMIFAVENIPAPLGEAGSLAGFVEALDHPRVKICLDAGHANITNGESIESAFRQLAPLAAATHIHDNRGIQDTHMVPGKGSIPWASLWNALEEAAYAGPITYELRRGGNCTYAETLSELGRSTPPRQALDHFRANTRMREGV